MNDLVDGVRRRVGWAVTGLAPQRLKARLSGPRVLANSVPKSGTNLLTRCLSLFPMLRPSFQHVSMNYNRRSSTEELERKAVTTGRGQYTSGHIFHTEANAAIVERNQLTMPLMVRDPRDVVTSHFHYVAEKHPGHRLHGYYRSLPDDDARMMASIRGVDGEYTDDGDRLEGIGEWMDAFMGWRNKPYVTIIRFEDLIGPDGGGDQDRQRAAVRELAMHLKVTLSEPELGYVANNVFSPGSSTFRKGLIGDWRNHFSEEHVSAFKAEAGHWLVELGYETDPDWLT